MDHPKDHSLFGLGLPGSTQTQTSGTLAESSAVAGDSSPLALDFFFAFLGAQNESRDVDVVKKTTQTRQ